jgi:hypothetical protein
MPLPLVSLQWLLCVGIWLCGLMVQLIRGSEFEPLAMVGGVMWACGNAATVPIIQMIGLGVGMCLWGTATLIMGWASGRFGFLGINKQTVENQAMNIIGLLLCVASMGLMFQVKSVKEEEEAARLHSGLDHGLLLDDSSTAMSITAENPHRSYVLHKREYNEEPSPPEMAGAAGVQEGGQGAVHATEPKWTDKLNPTTRRGLGIIMSLGAGWSVAWVMSICAGCMRATGTWKQSTHCALSIGCTQLV